MVWVKTYRTPDPARALRDLGGSARRELLLANGVSQRQLRNALDRGEIARVHRGCYSLPESKFSVTNARIFRAQLTCISLCEHVGLPLLRRPEVTHLLVPRDRSAARPGLRSLESVLLHRFPWYEAGELTSDVSIAIDLAGRCIPPLDQLVLVDAALQRGLMMPSEIDTFRASSERRRVFLRNTADARAESPLETIARWTLRRARLRVEPQARIPGAGRVDLLVEGRVVVELDGRAYHSEERAFQADRTRDRALAAAGYSVLRYTYSDVMNSPQMLVAEVQSALLRTRTR